MPAVLYFAATFRINILTLQIFQKKFEADEIVSALVTLRYRIAEFLAPWPRRGCGFWSAAAHSRKNCRAEWRRAVATDVNWVCLPQSSR